MVDYKQTQKESVKGDTNQQKSEEPEFLTATPEMKDLLDQVKKFAKSEAPVLITGESGVGKEVIARLIHNHSQRKNDPFVVINSGAIPADLIESELFGYEKGAFTGANSTKEGCFELANQGTLFMDEIGDMPLSMQVKVLRAVEQQSFRRIGGTKEVNLDVRIVSATNKILMEKVVDNSFRGDLFQRINVLELYIPPLRRRPLDIPLLLEHFLDNFTDKYQCPDMHFSDEAREILVEYNWPGNVRELKNIVERCVILSPDEEIETSMLPDRFLGIQPKGAWGSTDIPKNDDVIQVPLGVTMEQVERAVVKQTLSLVDNNKTEAARILGLTRKTLHKKAKEADNSNND